MNNVQLNDHDRWQFTTCWQYHDQVRNQKVDDEKMMQYEEAVKPYCDRVRKECHALWKAQKDKVNQNASTPMPLFGSEKCCMNDSCHNKVSWEWSYDKNYCAGDCCVEDLVEPGVSHQMKMNCIRMELLRYFEKMEQELDAMAVPTTPLGEFSMFALNSPTSVQEPVDDDLIFPMDWDEFELLSEESLISEVKDLLCDEVLTVE